MVTWTLIIVLRLSSGTAGVAVPSFKTVEACIAAANFSRQRGAVADAFCVPVR